MENVTNVLLNSKASLSQMTKIVHPELGSRAQPRELRKATAFSGVEQNVTLPSCVMRSTPLRCVEYSTFFAFNCLLMSSKDLRFLRVP